MPLRAPRACGHCGGVHRSGERCQRVAARERERKANFDRHRPGARHRGYDADWEAAAKAFLAEPGNQRCTCGAPAVVVRHIVSVRRRPDLRMVRSNWLPGCKRCNSIDTAVERSQERI